MSDKCSITDGKIERMWVGSPTSTDFSDSAAYNARTWFGVDMAKGDSYTAFTETSNGIYCNEIKIYFSPENAAMLNQMVAYFASVSIKQPQPSRLFRLLQSIFNYR